MFPVNEPARLNEINERVYGAIMIMRDYCKPTK